MQKKIQENELIYGYVCDGVATLIGEIGITGYMAYILTIEETYDRNDQRERPETATINSLL
jgi:hypothetical protein